MIILSDYELSRKEDSHVFLVNRKETCICPDCQSPLVHRDFRPRIMRIEGGEKRFIHIERMRCTNGGCGRIHNALPDCLVPYKHYASEVIAGVLDGVVTPDDTEDEDYPCEATMLRWKHWLMANLLRIDGYLKSIVYQLLGSGEGILHFTVSLLETLRSSSACWLEAILRMIYNPGGFLEAA